MAKLQELIPCVGNYDFRHSCCLPMHREQHQRPHTSESSSSASLCFHFPTSDSTTCAEAKFAMTHRDPSFPPKDICTWEQISRSWNNLSWVGLVAISECTCQVETRAFPTCHPRSRAPRKGFAFATTRARIFVPPSTMRCCAHRSTLTTGHWINNKKRKMGTTSTRPKNSRGLGRVVFKTLSIK